MTAVTVFIPSYNSALTLEAVTRAACEQQDCDLEVLVIDDASTDDSQAILERLAAEYANIRLVFNDTNAGLAANFNRAFDLARTPIVVILHADALPGSPHLASTLAGHFNDPTVAAAVAPWVLSTEDLSTIDAVYAAAIRFNYGQREIEALRIHEVPVVDSRCVAFRRQLVHQVGGFRPIHKVCSEGIDLSWRLRETGGRFILDPRVHVFHLCKGHHSGLSSNWSKSFLYARMDAVMHFLYPQVIEVRPQFIESLMLISAGLLVSPTVPLWAAVTVACGSVLAGLRVSRRMTLGLLIMIGQAAVPIGLTLALAAVFGSEPSPQLVRAGLAAGVTMAALRAPAAKIMRLWRLRHSRHEVAAALPIIAVDEVIQAAGSFAGLAAARGIVRTIRKSAS